jgi:tape measure domain-containing protein
MIVRELITKLGFKVDGTTLGQGEKAVDGLRDRADRAADAIRNIFFALAGGAAVKSVIAIGDEMQSLRARIGMLPQTVGDATAALDQVYEHAILTRQSAEIYGAAYARIGNAAKNYITDQESLLAVTDTISAALVVGKASTAEASAAMLQFTQALGSGVLQGDEFRSMAEAAPQYLDKLAETLGIPREQLKKMASEGKLTSKAVIEATKKMHDYFMDQMLKMPLGVGDAMNIIGVKWSRMIEHLDRESMFITRIANFILSGFDSIADGVDWLGAKFNGFSNVVRFALIAIGVAATAWAAPFIAGAVAAVVAMLPMILTIGLVALALDDLYSWLKGGESVIGQFLGPWAVFKVKIEETWQTLKDFAEWVRTKFAGVGNVLGGVFTLDTSQIQRGIDQIKGANMAAAYSAEPGQALTLPGSAQPRSIMAQTTVNLTVPLGTSPTDTQFFSQAAQSAFGQVNKNLAGDLGVYAP